MGVIGVEHVVGAPWVRNKQAMLNMAGNVCAHCDEKIFPPRDICPNCGDDVKEVYVFNSIKKETAKNNVLQTGD